MDANRSIRSDSNFSIERLINLLQTFEIVRSPSDQPGRLIVAVPAPDARR